MPSIQLPNISSSTVELGTLKVGEDFKINDTRSRHPGLLGTKITDTQAVVYTDYGIGIKTVTKDLKVTPLTLKLVITEE